MAKYILEQIKIENAMAELLSKTNGDNVMVVYNGAESTLTAALAGIITDIAGLPDAAAVTAVVNERVNALIDGAPAAYDTLKEIADYITTHGDEAAALTAALGNKVDKVSGKGLSTNDFTTALKTKLESMVGITQAEKDTWNAKAGTATATQSENGLMSKTDKKRLDGLRGVRYGTTAPADMLDGELFVRVVE